MLLGLSICMLSAPAGYCIRAARGAASSTGHAFDDGEATHAARCERLALPADVRTASRIGRVGRVGGRRRMQTPLAASTASHGCAARSVAHDEAQREVPLRALSGGAELSRDVCGVMWITCCGETSQVPCLCGLSCLSRVQA